MVDNDFNKSQYAQNAQQYLDSNNRGTIGGGTPQSRVELLKPYLPPGRSIFEIGSGGGHDAKALQKAGYEVVARDYVAEFVEICKKAGLQSVFFDAKADEFPEADAVYANAVFVHFTPEEVADCLGRIKTKLKNEKIIFISVLKGEGAERSARGRGFRRDFTYYLSFSL